MKRVVVVDAYSSGNLLAPEFIKQGFECFHLQTQKEVPSCYLNSFRPEDFSKNILLTPNHAENLKLIREIAPSGIIAATEAGVEPADRMSEALGLLTNGTKLSQARRDKFKMAQALKEAGIAYIPSFQTSDAEAAMQWIDENKAWPAVIKPLDSGGSEGVTICNTRMEVLGAFRTLLGKKNMLNIPITNLLVQKLVVGREYIVDCVSLHGKHKIAALWKVTKRLRDGSSFIYDSDELMPLHGEAQACLIDYTRKVLDALGIKHGPSHNELVLTGEGPVLMESGARPHGAGTPAYTDQALGFNQSGLTADIYANPEKFLAEVDQPYFMRKNLRAIALISEVSGTFERLSAEDEIRSLPSFHALRFALKTGELLVRTTDGTNYPGMVILLHEDSQVIDQDVSRIRELEKSGLYRVRS